MSEEIEKHWNNIYQSKNANQYSWTQETPLTSLEFIKSFNLPYSANIIDIGGGESKLVDFLLNEGFYNTTVLDISEKALEKTKKRLGQKANNIKWIVSDVTSFNPTEKYDLWHDRATFHFLTTFESISLYIDIASKAVNGFLTIGTFSEKGPDKCSGLEIRKYSENQLEETLSKDFIKIKCKKEDHITPFNTLQNFLFCSFKRSA
jgi:hypothetical protein